MFNTWYFFEHYDAAVLDVLTELYDKIIHIRFRAMNRRQKGVFAKNSIPLAQADLDYCAVVHKLKELGYTKTISVEWHGIDKVHMWDSAEQDLAFLKEC